MASEVISHAIFAFSHPTPSGRVQGRHKHHHDYLRSKLSGRGHACFLEVLIFNDLRNRAWKRGLKKAAFPRSRLNGI